MELYAVLDAASGQPVGHFLLDIFSRPGKFGHQCVVPLTPCYTPVEGTTSTMLMSTPTEACCDRTELPVMDGSHGPCPTTGEAKKWFEPRSPACSQVTVFGPERGFGLAKWLKMADLRYLGDLALE